MEEVGQRLTARSCGDNPYRDYCQVLARLQKIRGCYAMAAGLAAYQKHLGIREAARGDRLSGRRRDARPGALVRVPRATGWGSGVR